MKKIIAPINFFLLISIPNTLAQTINPNNELVFKIERKFDTGLVFLMDNDKFELSDYYPRNYLKRMFINNKPLDSTGLQLDISIVSGRKAYGIKRNTSESFNHLFNGYNYQNELYEIDFTTRTLKSLKRFDNTEVNALLNFYSIRPEGNDSIIYWMNPKTLKIEEWITTYPHFPHLDIYDAQRFFELGNITQIGETDLLMEFVDCSSDCYNYKYLTFDFKTKIYSSLKWYDSLRVEEMKHSKSSSDPDTGYSRVEFLTKTLDELYFTYGYFDNGDVIKHDYDYIFDSNFNRITLALKKTTYSSRYNYKNGKRTSLMCQSVLDDEKIVFIPYRLTLPNERSFYKIYNNKEILDDDLKIFNEPELLVLKNFIFAKHNYKFDSEFYQAYFNLFEFYHSETKRKNRTKEINHLLTKSDKANLSLLNKKLKKYSK